jgi:hypothetical protein
MSPASIALQLLPLIGVRTLHADAVPQNGVALDDGDIDACAIAITQALQEIFGLGPVALSEQRYSSVLRPPTNVTFTATQYSTTISAFTTWASWMEGCTIQGGDGEDNELISATELLRPYMGSSSSVSATVYADAILLPSWVKNTIEPVETPQVRGLSGVTSREEFYGYGHPYYYSDEPAHRSGAYNYTTRTKTIGDPCVYFVEPRLDPDAGALPLFMRFNPMPGQAIPVTFRVKRKPPRITSSNIVDGGTAETAGRLYLQPLESEEDAGAGVDLVIPTDWHESILLPFAKKWFIAHPAFNNASAAAQIMDQYRVAKAELESFAPQISPTQGHYR